MLSFKRGALYFFYLLMLWFVLFVYHLVETKLAVESARTFNPTPLFFLETFFYIAVGMYLRLPWFLSQWKKEGQWKINSLKLSCIGLPAFYVSFMTYLGGLTPLAKFPMLFQLNRLFLGFPFFSNINGVLLGLLILDSIYKINVNKPDEL